MRTFLPPEWVKQQAIQLTWPHQYGDWAEVLPEADQVFVQMTVAIAAHQTVWITAYDSTHQEHIQNLLTQKWMDTSHQENIRFFIAKSNDVWVRDHGALTVKNSDHQWQYLDFIFNGWGNKYPSDLDNQITQRLTEQDAYQSRQGTPIEMVLEGGGLEVNGAGALLTTTRCLLNQNRNPHLNQATIEAKLKQYLGVTEIYWLHTGGLLGDDTDGHIDTIARFCAEDLIVYQGCDDPNDPHYEDLWAMQQELAAMPFKLVKLPMPDACFDEDGRRLSAGYANFLITNAVILLPIYGVKQDQLAIEVMQSVFPNHQIVAINSVALIKQNGSIHCATMQIPE